MAPKPIGPCADSTLLTACFSQCALPCTAIAHDDNANKPSAVKTCRELPTINQAAPVRPPPSIPSIGPAHPDFSQLQRKLRIRPPPKPGKTCERIIHLVGLEYVGEYNARFVFNPFRTAVPFWGQTTKNLTGLSPKRDCSPKRVNIRATKKVVQSRREWYE